MLRTRVAYQGTGTMLKRLATACAAGLLSAAAAAALTGAAALPLAKAPAAATTATEPQVQIERVHGCHRGIQRDYRGWHYHSGACVRVPTAPPGLYDVPAYRRWYRGPYCSYQCRFIGPVKTCQQVCR